MLTKLLKTQQLPWTHTYTLIYYDAIPHTPVCGVFVKLQSKLVVRTAFDFSTHLSVQTREFKI